jgi:hypothetical protein
VEWLKVAPTMAVQTFRLPSSKRYEIRFEMLKREDSDSGEAKLLSVETISFVKGSIEGRYALHGFDPASRTRSSEISAEIIYSIKSGDLGLNISIHKERKRLATVIMRFNHLTHICQPRLPFAPCDAGRWAVNERSVKQST